MKYLSAFLVSVAMLLPISAAVAAERSEGDRIETKSERQKQLDALFENQRRHRQWQMKVRREQELKKQRPPVPTFTIPQPALVDPRYDRRYDQRNDPRFDRRFFDDHRGGQYVLIPGHYQVVYGRMVYVPPHYQFIRR